MNELDLARKWFEVKQGMIDKSYINQESGEEIEVSEALFNTLQPYIKSEKLYSLQITSKDKIIGVYHCYVSRKGITSIQLLKEDKSEITLTHLKEEEELIGYVTKVIEPHLDKENSSEETVIFSKANYYSFIAAMNMKKLDKAVEILQSMGLGHELALDAAQGFFEKNLFIHLSYQDYKLEDTSTDMLMFYIGQLSCWYINISSNENYPLKLCSIGTEACLEGISQFMKLRYNPL